MGFTQACNTPFSGFVQITNSLIPITKSFYHLSLGLAADGAKLAMWNLLQVGYRLIGFIHDEILVEIKEDSDWTQEAKMVESIFVESMQELTGTIPISCSFALSRYWSKKAEAVYEPQTNKLLLWTDPSEAASATKEQKEEAESVYISSDEAVFICCTNQLQSPRVD